MTFATGGDGHAGQRDAVALEHDLKGPVQNAPMRDLAVLVRRARLLVVILVVILVVGCAPAPSPSISVPATASPTAVAPALATPPGEPSSTPGPPVEHRIGVRPGPDGGEFFDRTTNDRFVPRGINLIRLAGGHHSTFDVGRYDSARIEATFAEVATLGYNTVRAFLDQGGLAGGEHGLSAAYLDNVADFLVRARAAGLVVVLTADWLPDGPAFAYDRDPLIDHVNSLYLSAGGLEANERFFRVFAQALVDRGAPLDALLAYELRNELYFSDVYPPFSLASGTVTTANGRTYDLRSPEDRRAMIEDNLVFWVDTMRAAIREVDPTALVTTGFFQPKEPNTSRVGDDRLIETKDVIAASTLDFIDLHGYPGGELDLRQIVENFALPARTDKPILLGEFGAERGPYPEIGDALRTLVTWQVESCDHGFDGWLQWTWDTAEQPEFWNAVDADGALADALSPRVRPDPCSFGDLELAVDLTRNAKASASSAVAGFPASYAIDGLPDTYWNSSGAPAQTIRIDLRSARTVTKIGLLVAQDPAGASRHVVAIRGSTGTWRTVHVFTGTTRDGQWLTFEPDEPLMGVRYIRVQTTSLAGGLWPAWREIRVLGPIAPTP